MKLELLRFHDSGEDTIGLLLDVTHEKQFLCFTLEDQKQDVKIKGETRIPAGDYEIKLRDVGGKHQRYAMRFPAFHRGMLWLRGVPDFEYVLIHIGNTDDDTAGCILVGDGVAHNKNRHAHLIGSTKAYQRVYQQITEPMGRGEAVMISIRDFS